MDKNRPLQKLPGKNSARFLVFIAFTSVLSVIFYNLLSKQYAQVVISSDRAQLTDFVYYLENVKEFWFGSVTQLYRPETTQIILARLLGDIFSPSMLLHIIPPALVIWFPLAVIGLKSTAWAHAIWLAFSYALMGQAFLNLYIFVNQRIKTASYILIVIFLSSFFSFVTLASIILGQTSVFMGAILILLLHHLKNMHSSQTSTNVWLILYGILLGMKPQFFVFGLVILLLFSRKNEAIWVIALTILICLILTPRLGWLWPFEYLSIIGKHSTATLPDFFSDTIILDIMTNFRGAFYKYIGVNVATTISTLIFIGSIITVLIVGLCRTIQFPVNKSLAWPDHAKWVWCIVMLESYRLFSPHLYTYEDFLAVPLIAIVFLNAPAKLKGTFWTFLISILFFVNLQSGIVINHHLQLLFWLLKLGFGVCVVISIWPIRNLVNTGKSKNYDTRDDPIAEH